MSTTFLYDKNGIEQIVQLYYEKYKSTHNAKISIVVNKESVGAGMQEQEGAVLSAKISGVKVIGNIVASVEEELSVAELEQIVKTILEDSGYDTSSVRFDYGLKEECSGSYMNEICTKTPYFNGLHANINGEKVKKL